MKDSAIYTSACKSKNLWQEYRIYQDRLEFDTLFGKMKIPFEQIEKVSVSESDLKGLVKGDLQLKNFRPALKLDWANFTEHVVLDKIEGYIRRILFSPDDPEKFSAALNDAVNNYKRNFKQ